MTIPIGIKGSLECTVLQKNLKELHLEAMDICLQVLMETAKVVSTATVVWNSVLIISHITFWDCHLHIFPTAFLKIAGCNEL